MKSPGDVVDFVEDNEVRFDESPGSEGAPGACSDEFNDIRVESPTHIDAIGLQRAFQNNGDGARLADRDLENSWHGPNAGGRLGPKRSEIREKANSKRRAS